MFKSADPDYFISCVDVTRIDEYRAEAAKLRPLPGQGFAGTEPNWLSWSSTGSSPGRTNRRTSSGRETP